MADQKKPTERMKAALWAMVKREMHGMATVTNRALPLRLMRRMERLGLVQRAGRVVVCDEDGRAVQPERERDGWTVTQEGLAVVENTIDELVHSVQGSGILWNIVERYAGRELSDAGRLCVTAPALEGS